PLAVRLRDGHLPCGPARDPERALRGSAARWCESMADVPQHYAAAPHASRVLQSGHAGDPGVPGIQRAVRDHGRRATEVHLSAAAHDLRRGVQVLRNRLRKRSFLVPLHHRRHFHAAGVLVLPALGVLRAGGLEEMTPGASRTLRYAVLIGVGFIMRYPLLWMAGSALKPNHEIFTSIGFIPRQPTAEGFAEGWRTSTEYTCATYLLNTFEIIVPKVLP